jgi:hypothetical protein
MISMHRINATACRIRPLEFNAKYRTHSVTKSKANRNGAKKTREAMGRGKRSDIKVTLWTIRATVVEVKRARRAG